jgi:hypothetical protein
MEVRNDSALAGGNWNKLVARALDDCERYWFLIHYTSRQYRLNGATDGGSRTCCSIVVGE